MFFPKKDLGMIKSGIFILSVLMLLASNAFAARLHFTLNFQEHLVCAYDQKAQDYCKSDKPADSSGGVLSAVVTEDSVATFIWGPYEYQFIVDSIENAIGRDGKAFLVISGFTQNSVFKFIMSSKYATLINEGKWLTIFSAGNKQGGNSYFLDYRVNSCAKCMYDSVLQKYEKCDFDDYSQTYMSSIKFQFRRDSLYVKYWPNLPEVKVSNVYDNNPEIIVGKNLRGERVSIVIGGDYFNVILPEKIKYSYGEPYGDENAGFSVVGSAVAVSKNILITNAHVVNRVSRLRLYLDGKRLETSSVDVVAVFPTSLLDLSIIRVEGVHLNACPIATNEPNLGSDVLVYGYPMIDVQGEDLKVTKGIVSGKNGYRGDRATFQIDAAVQEGNSGGPIVSNGKIIGLATSTLNFDGVQNVNFGIKANKIIHLLKFEDVTPKSTTNDFSKCTYMLVGQ
ncbi:serine protease [uncultured Fibrobacter sp.]|uniref:S1C family serine protease n=1 Tax=uncultured Fibrobacter sp. TaxID=261512 RepID=UPI002805C140|nr:serine protease [uncultured Fibrobacter sp.]